MGLIFDIIDALIDGIIAIWDAAVKIFKSIVNFFADIVNWLRELITPDKDAVAIDLPKIIDDAKRRGDVINLGIKGTDGVAAAIYNPATHKVEKLKSVDSNQRDDAAKEILNGRKVVILE